MRFLRTISTRHLLAIITGLVIAIAGGTAIALAAAGNGPVPRPEPLADAVHTALAAPTVPGISARISFTDNLIDASDIQGSDPLLQGASGRLWFSSATHKLRIELQSDNGDAQLVVDARSFWVYDPTSTTAYEGTLPAQARPASKRHHAGAETIPSVAQIQSDLNKLMRHINLSGATPSDVAGQPTYTLRASAKRGGGLLGGVQLAWDAARGVPLRFAVYASGDPSPVLQLKATDISFGSVPASDFAISPPSGAKVVKVAVPGSGASARHAGRRASRAAETSGVSAVSRKVPFGLSAPKSLSGLRRESVTLLDWAAHPAALVTYGRGLGGIAVIEQRAGTARSVPGGDSGDQGRGLSLPTVSINGSSAQELGTELGTVLTFTRGQVAYTVLGSVTPAAAQAAARAL